VRAGSYAVKHDAPPGYHGTSVPDSTVVNVGPAGSASATVNFPDAVTPGGWVSVLAFEDLNANGVQDAGEGPIQNLRVNVTPGTEIEYTNSSGAAMLFSPTGSFSVTAAAPDSFSFTTPNPASGTMSNGGSASIMFGLLKTEVGTIQGTVFRDNNRDGVMNGTDAGIPNAWVGITNGGGITIQG